MIAEVELKKTNAENENGEMILFVCTGNTCRSPMAEAVFNRFYADGEKKRYAESAGLFAGGSPISANAENALRRIGIENFTHISRNVSEELMEKASLVVGISASHATSLILAFPRYASKITSLPTDIPDPYGGNEKEYEECLRMILSALREMFGEPTGEASEK